SDLEQIQGVWKVVKAEVPGQEASKEATEAFRNVRITIARGKMTAQWASDPNKKAEETFKLDASKNPKAIDMTVTIVAVHTFKSVGDSIGGGEDEKKPKTPPGPSPEPTKTQKMVLGLY